MLTPDRLSALDRAFLTVEEGPLHMHVGAVTVFEGGGLVAEDGALDFPALRSALSHTLEALPRFRQHVRNVPLLGTVWSADPSFRLDYHVRHTAIPRPGTMEQLHSLAGRVFSQRLDRERPLWEMWFVEGLEGGRFAVITKAHHAMLDGVAGMGMLATLFSLAPAPLPPADGARLPALDEPSLLEHARGLLRHRLDVLPHARERLRHLTSTEGRGGAKDALEGLVDILKSAFQPARATPLNPEKIGPHRGFDGVRLDLERLKRVRRAEGGTLNDVALAMVTGAVRRHLERRGVDPAELGEVRALVPVSIRPKDASPSQGNHIALLIAHLPVGEPDPLARLAAIRAHTAQLKQGSHEVEGVALVEELSDLGPERLVGAVFEAALHFLPFNLIVTNIPGPPVPLYLGPAKLEALYPMVPLFARQSFGVALASYDGGLFVGVNSDADAVPDLRELLEDLVAAEAELCAAVPTKA